ncbi:phage integrase N-terminal SAM-like domain-containing protein [Tardiphaga sp. P9-11]|uniref:phage integrase N-terminal SAM-like domain-containing protein n=1 Tax=Tardiphaga sp. P9-11 TaxID=2024614 RepID=UPI0011F238B3|nr:phage integrase N-terminal SAM-like domain-containing protein [Tardiphaga sp. P9-11]KAA0077808.1 recombinase XerD [Tardiphaga sp. P9-11]
MLYRMVRPVLRKGSRNRQFHQRIPTDIRSRIAGLRLDIPLGNSTVSRTLSADTETVRLSLQTDDPNEVKRRQAGVATYLASVWAAVRKDRPVSLTHRQATALAGELFRAWADDGAARSLAIEQAPEGGWRRVQNETDEDRNAEWAAVNAYWAKVGSTGRSEDLEAPLGPLIKRVLLKEGVGEVDEQSRLMLLEAFWKALRDAFEIRERYSQGDYRADPKADRYPAWIPGGAEPKALDRGSAVSQGKRTGLTQLVADWWKEAQSSGLKPSTHESYRNTMAKFVAFLGHDDASRVSKDDVLAFKNDRLASGVSAKTVKDSDLAGLKTLLGWAVSNNRLPDNPAQGATIKLGRRLKLRSKGFTDQEALDVLRHAMAYKPRGDAPKLAAVKQWVPWLCAFTGSRVGEMLQLRKQDVRLEGGHWVALITPEAGTVKSNEAREVVLHPQLVELGFVDFVQQSDVGHLFITPRPRDGDLMAPIKTARNKLGAFVREVVADPNVDPNHGWRHRFKTVGRECGVADTVLDALQGHAAATVGDRYGDVTVKARAAAIAKFPRYDLERKAADGVVK